MEPRFEYEKIREEIRSEYMLITSRLTWFVTSQSFLVSAFAISQANGFVWFRWFSTLLLPAVALLLTLLALPAIVSACKTIELWHQKQAAFFARQPEFREAFVLARKPWMEEQGLLFPQLMPILFAVFWLVIPIVTYFLG